MEERGSMIVGLLSSSFSVGCTNMGCGGGHLFPLYCGTLVFMDLDGDCWVVWVGVWDGLWAG